MPSLFDLTGKVAVVTGSTKGIGLAIATRMAEHGATVVISSRKADVCERVAAGIVESGGKAVVIPCHIGRKEELQNLVDQTVARCGGIDILVENAGVNPFLGPAADMPDEAFDRVMGSNVRSNVWLANMAIPHMVPRGGGAVIIISSIGGLRGTAQLGAYGISKAADMQLARNIAVEWGPKNIRANAIAPGLVRTDFARALWENPVLYRRRTKDTPLQRIGEPDEIAGAAVFLSYPALGLLFLTILLSYSRGALLAAVVGGGFWIATVKPRRLRAAALVLVGATGAAAGAAWAFSQSALADDRVPLDLREQAGVQFAVLVVALIVVLALTGLAVGFVALGRQPSPHARRRIGTVLLVMLALVPVGLAVAGQAGREGLADSISSRWKSLTDPNAGSPNNQPGRLTAAGSVRARYWDEALRIFSDNAVKGVGAGGYATVRKRYRTADPAVRTAHGYVVQTAADLGIAGLAISFALMAVWLASAAAATGLRRRDRGAPFSPERIGLLTLAAVVLVFGVHSAIDWTWFVPANAVTALLAAGWVAGRGPLGATEARRVHAGLGERLRAGLGERARAISAAAVVLVAIVAAWTVWQPLRSDDLGQQSLATLEAGNVDAARSQAQAARDHDPLAVEPLFKLGTIEEQAGNRQIQARAAFQQAVRLQPANPEPWIQLANFELRSGDPKAAETASRRAVYLDPRSARPLGVFLDARRQIAAARASTK